MIELCEGVRNTQYMHIKYIHIYTLSAPEKFANAEFTATTVCIRRPREELKMTTAGCYRRRGV